MDDQKGGAVTLPYRTTPEDLVRLLEARARGRDLAQIQTLNFPTQGFQGTLTAASGLGFLQADSGELTPSGREFALAQSSERPALVRTALLRYQPYELLLEAIFSRGQSRETPIQWIETWWSTHGFGNSQTNRDEGGFVFGKFAAFAGLGSFLIGRRGKPTRIEWTAAARDAVLLRQDDPAAKSLPSDAVSAERVSEAPTTSSVRTEGDLATQSPRLDEGRRVGRNVLSMTLAQGRSVSIDLPERLTASEKKRLMALVELMVETDESDATDTQRS